MSAGATGEGTLHLPADLSRETLLDRMRTCEQTRGQTVLQHGESVWQHFQALLDHLSGRKAAPAWWRVPDWARRPCLLDRLPPIDVLEEYAVFHDCGKPFCLLVDADGRRHFPGHAAASEQAWLAAGGSPQAAKLMGMDMEAHLLKADGVAAFAARLEAAALLLMALAEVHANAELFGGQQSDSFN